jgi:hypothetical protein
LYVARPLDPHRSKKSGPYTDWLAAALANDKLGRALSNMMHDWFLADEDAEFAEGIPAAV